MPRPSTSGSPASAPAPSTRRSSSWSTPTPGTAVVDVTVYGRRGPVDAPGCAACRCPAAPACGSTSRRWCRAATSSRSRSSPPAAGSAPPCWTRYDRARLRGPATGLAARQAEPGHRATCCSGSRRRHRAAHAAARQPGTDEVRADIRVVTDGVGVRRRTGIDDDPGPAAERRPGLGRRACCRPGDAAGALGLLVESSGPVTASVRSSSTATCATPPPPTTGRPATSPVRARRADRQPSVVLPAPTAAGAVTVVARAADGEVVARRTGIEVAPDRGAALELPDEAVLVRRQHRRAPPVDRRRCWPPRDGAAVGPAAGRLLRSGLVAARPPRPARSGRRRRPRSAGRPASASMPSSSATCSTTTVSTIASRSVRVSQRCSIGRRKSTSRVGVAPVPRTSDDSGTVPGSQSSGICGVSSTAYSTRPSRSCQRSSMSVTMSRTRSSKRSRRCAARGARVTRPRPRDLACRVRAGPGCGVVRLARRARVIHAASLIRAGAVRRYRLPRESCPPLFAHRLRPRRGRDADLCLRRPDRRARPAGDLRRAARLRPVRRPQRAAVGAARVGGAAARARPGRPRSVRATTCSRSPTPCARPAARPRRRGSPRPRRPAASRPAGATCACSRPTDTRPRLTH